MSARAAQGAASPAASLLSIGQVLARLSGDFPDLSNSKLRFLEERGLVTPERTKSGYRKFSPADVERLRLILSLQRDHYLPLKVIRGYLADLDAGVTPVIPGVGATILPGVRRYTREEILSETGASSTLFSEAVSAGLIAPGESFGEDALSMAAALVGLQSQGIEPRHLRGFHTQVEREMSLIERALIPLNARKDAASRAKAAEQSAEIASQFDVVRTTLLRAALDRITR
ncbi:transcriptional regulator FtsR [Mycetocola spongiae]|uniref:transcriptional regulator FtsR n=1 Tax=Mycetocola spongiae TaxID=2859226 RepID=UPI001CF456E6|nr:MerR family transcriptional regulator [Mycetocola spongiae]UCR89813.1 MerR family transcriptional regulator [Mycetocola spongiae]